MTTVPQSTALMNTCILETPSRLLNESFRFAKDNLARCIRNYTLGWGISNAPLLYTTVVGRDTGWACLGADYVVPWFAPAALRVFRQLQSANGQIVEFIDMESGAHNDYGLNVSDNTPLYLWAINHHWQCTGDEQFRDEYLTSARRAADYLLHAMGTDGLLLTIPAGVQCRGISSWRNMLPDTMLAGQVTEINALSALALRETARFTGDARYDEGAAQLTQAVNDQLWAGDHYLLTRDTASGNGQVTGDEVFPVLCGTAPPERARMVLDRLSQPDFWTERGLRTVPNSDPAYHPSAGLGLTGGSWPNLTLWYAAAVAAYAPDRALRALEAVARPVVEEQPPEVRVRATEFAEYFDGDIGTNLGMELSPWVAPTFIWAVLEGLLGVRWAGGALHASCHWPSTWTECRVSNMPATGQPVSLALQR